MKIIKESTGELTEHQLLELLKDAGASNIRRIRTGWSAYLVDGISDVIHMFSNNNEFRYRGECYGIGAPVYSAIIDGHTYYTMFSNSSKERGMNVTITSKPRGFVAFN